MNVIGMTDQNSGCGYHRILLPLGFMQDIKGYVTNYITPDKTDGWDILIYNRLSPYDADWNKARELLQCKVVIDLDDYWKLPPSHINYGHYEEFGKRIENNIATADMVTVTNEALAAKVRPFNTNIKIFPNGIPFGSNQFTEDKVNSERVRIFWCGGVTHEQDLKLLKGPITKLKMYSDKIQMVLGGYTDTDPYSKSIWDRMFSYFTSGGSLPYKKLYSTRPINYMQIYEHADIMVIPLHDSEWHSCKSNLKILEAASKRIPCIVSNVEPYNNDKDCPVLWVNSQKDWFNHLNYLILNPEARAELGQQLYEWAKKKYNLKDINVGRRKAFADICEVPQHL